MRKINCFIVMLAILLACPVFSVNAQTAGFLDVNPDPVSMGMAGTGTVLEATPYAMWNNASGAALSEEKMQVGAAYSLWQPSSTSNNVFAVAGYGKVTKFMTVSAGFRYFGYGAYNLTGPDGIVTGTFKPVEMQAGIGLGFRILPILSVGANVSYVHSDIGGPEKGQAVSADFGALLDLRFIRVGFTAANIGSKISYGYSSYDLPANVRLGVGTVQKFGNEDRHALSVNLEGGLTVGTTSLFAGLGAQYEYNSLFRVSAGYHYGDAVAQFVGSYASVGLGVKVLGIALNAAYLIGTGENSPIGNTFSVGISYGF